MQCIWKFIDRFLDAICNMLKYCSVNQLHPYFLRWYLSSDFQVRHGSTQFAIQYLLSDRRSRASALRTCFELSKFDQVSTP
mmetsp:Transcript_8990/g.16942  ORF Transcript_8990/g.16942 Transcript_8990/m.16942 type:complete len:81 (-) Transcript_8990:497-739(-)